MFFSSIRVHQPFNFQGNKPFKIKLECFMFISRNEYNHVHCTIQENYYYAYKYTGFRPNPNGRSEGTYTKYASLDDKLDGIHWYQSYAKFGMGRASRDAQTDIRRGHITRDEGIALVKKYDGEVPKKDLNFFLKYINISEKYFWEIIDQYRKISNVWKKVNGKWKMLHLPKKMTNY